MFCIFFKQNTRCDEGNTAFILKSSVPEALPVLFDAADPRSEVGLRPRTHSVTVGV